MNKKQKKELKKSGTEFLKKSWKIEKHLYDMAAIEAVLAGDDLREYEEFSEKEYLFRRELDVICEVVRKRMEEEDIELD